MGLYLIADGTFSSVTTSYITVGDLIPLDYNKTITCSNEKSKSGSWYMLEYDKDKNYLNQNQLLTGTTATFTTQNPLTKYVAIDLGGGINLENAGEIMIETGSTASPYEPYQSQSYPISLGVNLWQPSEALSGYLPQTGSYPTTDPSYPNSRYILVPLIKGQSLTINNQGSPTSNFRMRYIDVDTNLIIGTVRQGTNGDYVTSTQDYAMANYNGIVTALKNVILGLWDFNGEITNMIAVYGTSVPIELAKISTYKDKIYNDDNDKKWYLRKEIGKVVLNGSESWGIGSSATSRSVFSLNTFTNKVAGQGNFYCDIFSYLGNAQTTDLGYAMSFNTGEYKNFCYAQVPTNVVTSQDNNAFKTWLSSHNATVYYPMITPTVTEITDETLISQLEAVKLLSGTQNNFTIDADTLPTLNLNYIGEANPHL